METKRLFIAIELPEPLREALDSYMQHIRKTIPELAHSSFCKKENLHITTLFLGDTDVSLIPELIQRLQITSFPSFTLTFEAIRFFPETRHPRMIWATCQPSEPFVSLVHSLEQALHDIVSLEKNERTPIAHCTLTRLRQFFMNDTIQLPPLLLPKEASTVQVNGISLIESKILNTGPKYTTLCTAMLS